MCPISAQWNHIQYIHIYCTALYTVHIYRMVLYTVHMYCMALYTVHMYVLYKYCMAGHRGIIYSMYVDTVWQLKVQSIHHILHIDGKSHWVNTRHARPRPHTLVMDHTVSLCVDRSMNPMLMGSLYFMAWYAFFALTLLVQLNSNNKLPARTKLTKWSTEPLPLPIRTSSGFLVTGMWGKALRMILDSPAARLQG